MNSFTKTPVNTVWFTCTCSVLLGLLVFAGEQAIDAVFSLSVVALYIAYASVLVLQLPLHLYSQAFSYRIPIAARFLGTNSFKEGPFSLGCFSAPCALIAVLFMFFMGVVLLFPATPSTDVADMNYTVVVLFGSLFLSLVWYYFPVYGGVHWFEGPIPTIGHDKETVPADSASELGSKKATVELSQAFV